MNYEHGRSFCSSVFLQRVDNFSVGCAVVIFSYFRLELHERFPHSRWCYCLPWKTVVLEMFWIIKQSSPFHLVLERALYLLVILWPWASGCVKSQFWAMKDAKMRRQKQGKDKGTLRKISPLSSPQCPTYHERSSDPFKRFIWNNTVDKEMYDLLTSSLAMTDLKISQVEAYWSCCSTKSYRK